MPESEGRNAKLVNVAGVVAEWVTYLKHISAIAAAVSLVAGVMIGFIDEHKAVVYIAGACFATFALIGFACRWVEGSWRTRLSTVQEKLNSCLESYEAFESEVFAYNRKPSREGRDNIYVLHEKYLAKLCQTAAFGFQVVKPWKGPFATNIKRIVLIPDEDGYLVPHYKPLARSYVFDEARLKYDITLEDKPIKIADSATYSQMFTPQIGQDYYIHHDLSVLVRELKAHRYVEPNDTSLKFYRSMIIFPIYGHLHRPTNEAWFRYNGYDVAGIMCVDSPKPGAFRDRIGVAREFDRGFMKQLTWYAFASFRLLDSLVIEAEQSDEAGGNEQQEGREKLKDVGEDPKPK
jgi:hypothetical protein